METDRYHELIKEAIARQSPAVLPADFTARTLHRLQREKAVRERRAEIAGLIAAALVSLTLIVMAGVILHHYGILPSQETVQETFASIKQNIKLYWVESLPYYGLAFLAGILLLSDYLLRRHWYNTHRKGFGS